MRDETEKTYLKFEKEMIVCYESKKQKFLLRNNSITQVLFFLLD